MQQEIVNTEQAAAWDGAEGAGWAREWERYDRSVRVYRDQMASASAVADGEQVLDIGCGNGQSTRDAARATPTGSALGVDLSSMMLERARAVAASEGLQNVGYEQGDAQVHPFAESSYDLAMSRFGAMFFADKPAAFANVGRSLRSGGRLLLVAWQPITENEQFRTIFGVLGAGRTLPSPPPGAPSPFGLAHPDLNRGWLEAAGFVDIDHVPVLGSFHAGADADDATAFLSGTTIAEHLLAGLDESARGAALEALHEAMRAHETPDGVLFDSATWFITARVR